MIFTLNKKVELKKEDLDSLKDKTAAELAGQWQYVRGLYHSAEAKKKEYILAFLNEILMQKDRITGRSLVEED